MPAAIPVTTPVEPTVAIPVLLLLQTPPGVVLASVLGVPMIIEVEPVIGATVGIELTVTEAEDEFEDKLDVEQVTTLR